MSIFSKLFSRDTEVSVKVAPDFITKNWRTGMWVMCDGKIGVLFKLDTICEVHLTDAKTGENTVAVQAPLASLRQARWLEIPEDRRLITAEKAKELGYGA